METEWVDGLPFTVRAVTYRLSLPLLLIAWENRWGN